MIVWGGDGYGRLNSGAKYSPSLDRWIATNPMGAPSPRAAHSAVWAGDRMVIWGGYDDSSLRTGARYYPTTDSWAPTAIAGAPTARSHQSALWTGSEMIVWGGSPLTNTGGRYDPVGNTWRATSVAGAPEPRFYHTAVWTGSDMLLWGGTGAQNFGNGGRYSPVSDTWSPISNVAAPSARSNHRAVWTGTQMLVWGGYDGSSYLGSGARYQLSSDTWAPTSTSEWASPRARHSAVWIDRQLFVWGGYGQQPWGSMDYLSTGAQYCPCATTDTTCNGLDDDCNGLVDDGYLANDTTCGVGACSSTGQLLCVAGHTQDTCLPGLAGPAESDCNGIDDNCDGLVDEGYVAQSTECGIGACASSGTTSCVAGAIVDSCSPGLPAPNDANCNDIDDDCDGSIDEDYLPQPTTCGIGACSAAGTTSCVAGVVQDSCSPGTPSASDATCDGGDDDCDGVADEDYVPIPTTCGAGACARTGMTACITGSVTDSCVPGVAAPDDATCDGIDNDCDGLVDEDAPVTTWFVDADGDGYGNPAVPNISCSHAPSFVPSGDDCDDGNASVWATPGEVPVLMEEHDQLTSITTLNWNAPAEAGCALSALRYDTLRSPIASDFDVSAVCLDPDGTDTMSLDGSTPPAETGLFYLVRARNACPNGFGTVGTQSRGNSRVGRTCP